MVNKKTAILYDPHFLEHDTGPGHVERPERLWAIVNHLHGARLWAQLDHLPFDRATEEQLLAVHTPRHVEFVRTAYTRGITVLDGVDTVIGEQSYNAALLAAGAVVKAIHSVISGEVRNAFCLVRPPGHHAESNKPMGFCLFNTIAIGARYAQRQHKVEKIAIVDWDVHHGNGTQEIFYSEPGVLYISTHQSPLYPGTGARIERGEGAGEGFTLNIPMPAGTKDEQFLAACRKDILPALEKYRPEMLLLSAGFDAHKDDPLANLMLTDNAFTAVTEMMSEIADKYCGGKIVSVLEGGYDLDALARSVEAHIRTLMA